MKIKISPFIYTIIFLIIFFVLYKGLQNSNIYTPNLKMEKNIPSFKAKIFENGNFVSEKIFQKDKFYLLNIWASWCLPCQKEHDFLMQLKNTHSIEIIGLNYKDKLSNARKFIEELGNPYALSLRDKDGTIAILFGAYGLPETYIIKDKKIIKKYIGPIDNKSIKEIITYTK